MDHKNNIKQKDSSPTGVLASLIKLDWIKYSLIKVKIGAGLLQRIGLELGFISIQSFWALINT